MTNPSGEQWRDITGTEEVFQWKDQWASKIHDNWSEIGGYLVGLKVSDAPWPDFRFRRPIPSIPEEKKECEHAWAYYQSGDEYHCTRCGISRTQWIEEDEPTLREQLEAMTNRAILADKRTSEAEEKIKELEPLAQIGREWQLDSSLEKWFPFTDIALASIRRSLNEAESRITEAEKERDEARKALEEIAKGQGEYSSDQLTHANNTIENMKSIALSALNEKVKG